MDLLPLLPAVRLVGVFERIAAAVAHMHERGVIHADLKPDNLVLDAGTNIKVIDFGVAQFPGVQRQRIRATPEYMAPETTTQRVLNEKTDIYSFAATMYRLTTQHFPPSTLNSVVLGERGFERQYVSVQGLNATVPDELADLIRDSLRFNPRYRPQNMEEVRARLESIGRDLGTRD